MATVTGNNAYVLGGSGTPANSNIREDLGNVIFNVSPYKTPFSSGIAKTRAVNDNHEWLTDTLTATSVTWQVEAETGKTGTADTRTRKGNYVGILEENAVVTKKAEMFDKAGIPGKEMAYQLMKKGKELHMGVETALLSINAKVAPTNSTAGEVGSVAAYINSNESVSGTGGTANSASTGATVPTPGSAETFSETTLAGLLDDVWENSGDFGNICIMADASRVSSMRAAVAGIADSVESDAATGEIYNRVAVYQSQFGPVKVVPNKHMPAEQIYILDMTSWGLAFGGGKMIHTTDIATQTSAEQKLLECYFTLEARSEESNAGYYAVS